MDVLESLRIGLRSIRGHKLRSALTTLGIVIGIAAVITFVTLGTSVKADVVSEVGGEGANYVFVLAEPREEGGPPGAAQPVFTERDVSQLREVEGVRAVVPSGTVPISAVTYRNTTVARSQVTASTPDLLDGATFTAGRSFRSGEREVVVNDAAVRLYPGNVSVGDELVINQRSGDAVNVTVVGVIEGGSPLNPFAGFSTQPRFYVPSDPFYDTVVESPSLGVRQRVYPQVTVVAEPTQTAAVKQRVQAVLDDSDAASLVPQSYAVTARTNEDLIDRLEGLIDRLTGFVTGIAVISLVVGAIGIANIMLVSVTERTKEIGIMKAVGARNRDVLQLFLVEAVILGVLGVVLGAPLGVAGGYVATQYADLPMVLAPEWFAIAVVVGLGVGVAAGLYPAWNAANVDPIDALRYE